MDNGLAKLLQKIDSLKKEGKLDLSSEEDLSLAVMNLISLEEHFYFSAEKTGKEKYLEFLETIRNQRQDLLRKLLPQTEGEVWCIAKHLLAASMRLIEVGTKYQSQGKKKEAQDFFSKAWSLYSMFWGLKLEMVKLEKTGEMEETKMRTDKKQIDLDERLEDLVKKLVDCCK